MKPASIDPRDISVVVQGPVTTEFTKPGLASIRRVLPGATIILSTWKGSDVRGLDYDVLIENDDPGSARLGGRPANYFRQIVSSLNGLRAVKTEYAAKIRSDMAFKGTGFLAYFAEYNALPFDEHYKVFRERIAILTTHNPRRNFKQPFHVSDWFFFGLTGDLVDLFDIPLVETDLVHSAEQYIWLSFLSKHHPFAAERSSSLTVPSPQNIERSERYFANNCILLTARQAGVRSLKYPGKGYTQTPALSDAGYYTFTEYQQMLNRYSAARITIVPNLLEETVYFTVYHLRMFVKTKLKKALPRVYGMLRRVANMR